MDESEFTNYFESERFLNLREDDDILKSKEPEILNWDRIDLTNNSKFLAGDIDVYRTLQKGLKETNPVYELDVDGKQHRSAKIMFLDKGALFLKESTQKSAEKEGFVYNLSKLANVNNYFEPTCSAVIDGSYYSVSNMLDSGYKSLSTWKKFDSNILDGLIKKAADDGISHKLAVFDAGISNFDRHRSNVFFNGTDLKLIDNGRSFLPYGKAFIPGYLRLSDETIMKSGNDDSVRLWLGSVRSNSKLFLFHALIDKLNISWGDKVCSKISDKWTDITTGRL